MSGLPAGVLDDAEPLHSAIGRYPPAVWLLCVPLELTVAVLEPCRTLVLRTPTTVTALTSDLPVASWAFVLDRQWAGGTRLVVRWRSDFRPTLGGKLLNQYLLEPVHFAMERKMLLGIRDRSERLARSGSRPYRVAA